MVQNTYVFVYLFSSLINLTGLKARRSRVLLPVLSIKRFLRCTSSVYTRVYVLRWSIHCEWSFDRKTVSRCCVTDRNAEGQPTRTPSYPRHQGHLLNHIKMVSTGPRHRKTTTSERGMMKQTTWCQIKENGAILGKSTNFVVKTTLE